MRHERCTQRSVPRGYALRALHTTLCREGVRDEHCTQRCTERVCVTSFAHNVAQRGYALRALHTTLCRKGVRYERCTQCSVQRGYVLRALYTTLCAGRTYVTSALHNALCGEGKRYERSTSVTAQRLVSQHAEGRSHEKDEALSPNMCSLVHLLTATINALLTHTNVSIQ